LKLKLPMTWVLHQKLLMSSLVNEFVDHLISGTLAEITKNIWKLRAKETWSMVKRVKC
jgi:hypothetical protein